MELKSFLVLAVSLVGIGAQYFDQAIVDQTKNLQQIEKYGRNISEYYNQGFQHLRDITGFGHRQNHSEQSNLDSRFDSLSPTTNGSIRQNNMDNRFDSLSPPSNGSIHGQYNATERFLNKTMTNMARGVCVKEVP